MTALHVSAKHKMLVVPTSDHIVSLFPESRSVTLEGNNFQLIPHHPAESFLLRNLGYEVPAPILTHYEWPGMFDPFDAQRQTAGLLSMNKRAYVLNSMGTGKTSACLWAWDYLRSRGLVGKLIVVAPLSTLRFTWAREVLNTLPHRKCQVVHHAQRAKRVEQLNNPDAEILIINHDGAKLLHSEIMEHPEIDAICIDELAVYRNGSSKRTKQMKELAQSMEWAWGMTGSPVPRSPTDVWSQCQIITPHTVPKFFNAFRDQMMIKLSQFKWAPKPNAIEKAYACMQPAVRFTLDDVVELPELTVKSLDVPLGKKQSKIYKSLMSSCHAAVGNQEITAANSAAVMMKLLQVATGFVYDSQRTVVSLDGDQRLDELVDAIDQNNNKLLVFVPFIHAMDGISERLDKEGIEHACVSGETNITKRGEIFNLFQNTDRYKVIVAHPQCLAHGVTLTAADTIVWYAPVTSLEIYEQANARISRVGQQNKQLVLHLQGTPVERKIYKLLQDNQQVQNSFLEMFADETNQNPIT